MSMLRAPRTRRKPRPDSALHATFATILPRIETHARVYFRGVQCPHQKADRIAETVALAWKWFLRLEARGKDATQFPSALASLAARAVRCGRGVCGLQAGPLGPHTKARQGSLCNRFPRSTLEGTRCLSACRITTRPTSKPRFGSTSPLGNRHAQSATGA